jgi:hypothetical protein
MATAHRHRNVRPTSPLEQSESRKSLSVAECSAARRRGEFLRALGVRVVGGGPRGCTPETKPLKRRGSR